MQDGALRRSHQPGEHVQHCRLTAARGPDETKKLAAANRQLDIAQGESRLPPVGDEHLVDIARLQHRVIRHGSPHVFVCRSCTL